jgi:hypothetical protein
MKQAIKAKKKSDVIAVALIFLMAGLLGTSARAQDTARIKTVLSLEYLNRDGTKILTGKLSAKKEGKYMPVNGMKLNFSYVSGKVRKSIGTEETGSKGKAMIEIPDGIIASGGTKGTYSFESSFAESGNYMNSSASVEIRNASMELTFLKKDTDKQVICKVWETGKDGMQVPVNELKIQFYVPRTFSLLKVGESTLSDGSASIDFPVTLPGDTRGGLTVVAKIEDNETYGNLEASGKIDWGKPLPPEIIVKRGLGDTNAPLWMVYTLIILLSLVWFHYMYVIFTVFRIRYLGKKNAESESIT